jgi:ribosome-binding protein aMBF1 (putative translation factor)
VREDLDAEAENRSHSPRNALGEVRRTAVARARQDRGWTPQALADALRDAGLPGSSATIKRACAAGEIQHTRTAGGHVRIDPAWVRETYPSLEARSEDAEAA